MNNNTVGSVVYNASINLASLRSSLKQADALVEGSYNKQAKNAQKASKSTASVASKDAQERIKAVEKEAQATAASISKYSPQIQKQFLSVERANLQVTNATAKAQFALQKYGEGSTQAQTAISRLNIAVQNQSQSQQRLSDMLNNSEKSTGRFSSAMNRAGAIAGATAAIIGTVFNKALGAISNSVGSAVRRVDTLNNSARTFENMGVASADSARAMAALESSIKGLPTPLDSAVRGMTSLTATYGDINKGQKVFSALNNAILGFGGTTAEVENAITQLSQLPLDGPLDAQTWNSLRNSGLTPVLTAMAKDSGMSVSAMKEAFGKGELSVQDFIDRLTKMDKEGGGGLKSLEKIAKDSTKGIGTGFSNMQTAITRGVGKIIESVGSDKISGAISSIGTGFEVVLTSIANIVSFVAGAGATFTNWVKENSTLVTNLAIIFGTLLIPQIIKFGVQSTIALAKYVAGLAVASVQTVAAGARMAAAWLLALGPIGIIVAAVAGATALIIANWEAVSTFVSGVWGNITQWASESWENIKKIFGGIGAWFGATFNDVRTRVSDVFNSIANFAKNTVDRIVGFFSGIGNTIGNFIAGAIKGVLNGALGLLEGFLNGPINLINGALDAINKLPGVNVSRIQSIKLPRFYNGGFTGNGGKYEPAGIVDRGEYVIHKEQVNQNTGLPKPGAVPGQSSNITLNLAGLVFNTKADKRQFANEIGKLINESSKANIGKISIVGV